MSETGGGAIVVRAVTVEATPLAIRPLERRDLLALHESLGMGLDHIEARWGETCAGQTTMFVAAIGDQVVGSVSFGERAEFPGLLHLFALAVEQRFQGQGIGTMLIRAVELEAQRRGLDGVYLGVANDNLHARRLYERLGYAEEGRPFVSRWTWRGNDGSSREVVELVHRLFKRFPGY